VSIDALALAGVNRDMLQSGVRLAASDVLISVRGPFDLVVSNPPYIAQREVAALQVEVRDHEPMTALTPGPRGTEVIERILDDARRVLRPGGQILMEIGFGQESLMRTMAEEKQFEIERFIDDLAAIPRVIVLSA